MIKQLSNKIDFGFILYGSIISLFSLILLIQFPYKSYLILPGITISLVAIYIVWRNINVLYYAFFILSVLYFDTGDGITFTDSIYLSITLLIIANLGIYLVSNFGNTLKTPLDKSFLALYVVLFYGLILGIIYGNPLFEVAAELTRYLPVFGYFFFRDLMTVEKRKSIFLSLLFVIILFVIARNFYFYREIIIQSTAIWQTESARVPVNEVIVLLGTVVFIVFASLYAKKSIAIVCLLLFGASFISLILTQSRGYWLAFLISSIAMLFLANGKSKIRIIIYGLVLLSTITAVVAIFFQDSLELIIDGLLKRVGTLGNVGMDSSLQDRYRETKVVLDKIFQNPIAGHGFGTTFRREAIRPRAIYIGPLSFIHNGYLTVWFKFGIVGLGVFLAFCYQILQFSRQFYLEKTKQFPKLLYLTIFATTSGMLIVNITSPQFYQFDGIFLFTFFSALISSELIKNQPELN